MGIVEFSERREPLPCLQGSSAFFSPFEKSVVEQADFPIRTPSWTASGPLLLGMALLGSSLLWMLLQMDYACPFMAVFRLPCPGCSMTRALQAACRLDFLQALRIHPLYPLVPVYGLWLPLNLYRGRRGKELALLLGSFVVLFTGVWLLRLGGCLPWQ